MNISEEAQVVQKTEAAFFDITVDWSCPSRDLGADTIVASAWTFEGEDSDLTLQDATISGDGKATTIWIGDGAEGGYYQVTNTISTTGGRVLTGTFIVEIVPHVYLTQSRCI